MKKLDKTDTISSRSTFTHETDKQFEAFTQTDTFTVCKVPTPTTKEVSKPTGPLSNIQEVNQPPKKRRQKTRTANSILKLMEKHRESERLRHHTLNRQLFLICEKVPEYVDKGKETKVVMMQRIISYIAYLENSVKIICSKLNVSSDSLWFLTNRIKEVNWSDPIKNECLSVNSEDSRDSGVSSLSMSRRLKLSSPTIDSTTDHASRDSALECSDAKTVHKDIGEDTSVIVDDEKKDVVLKKTDMEWFLNNEDAVIDQENANFNSILDISTEDHSVFEVPTSSFEVDLMKTREVKWLGSPDKFSFYGPATTGKGDVNFGIKFDPQLLDETGIEFSHSDIVSPDQVIPQVSIKQEITEMEDCHSNQNTVDSRNKEVDDINKRVIDEENDNQVVPQSFSRRKQSTPKKNSHQDLNWCEMPVEFTDDIHNADSSFSFASRADNKMVGSFMEVESSNTTDYCDQNCEFDMLEELSRVREKLLDAARHESASKQDLRRSSWLNGFMMYSCIHRKQFIRENPGMHTAQISKLVGQAWRKMTAEQKTIYNEQARLCSQELQHIIDEKTIV